MHSFIGIGGVEECRKSSCHRDNLVSRMILNA